MQLTLDEAKEYFMAMNCSKFHMARENGVKYEEYLALNISEQIEMNWRSEKFSMLHDKAKAGSGDNTLWKLINRMYDLVCVTKLPNFMKFL